MQTITSKRFIISVGGRPTALDCPGGNLAISSDDLFSKVRNTISQQIFYFTLLYSNYCTLCFSTLLNLLFSTLSSFSTFSVLFCPVLSHVIILLYSSLQSLLFSPLSTLLSLLYSSLPSLLCSVLSHDILLHYSSLPSLLCCI